MTRKKTVFTPAPKYTGTVTNQDGTVWNLTADAAVILRNWSCDWPRESPYESGRRVLAHEVYEPIPVFDVW